MIGETKRISEVDELRIDIGDVEMLPVKIIADYRENGGSGVIDFGTFTSEEMSQYTKEGNEFINSQLDSWKNPELLKSVPKISASGSCSSCIKKLDDGTVIMGRNMDVPSSFYPAYIFRGKGNGKDTYDTVNIGYPVPGTMTFDQIAETSSVPKMLVGSYVCDVFDVFNSEGLFLEANGRYPRGNLVTSSTNSNSDLRVCDITLTRYIGDHCKTIEEALEYVKTLDIYNSKTANVTTAFAVGMMDKTGRYGVLEIAFNKVIWNEGRPGFACGQANFYWDIEAFNSNNMNVGLGRWDEIIKRYNYINNSDDMKKVMDYIWYDSMITKGFEASKWPCDYATDYCEFGESLIRNKWIGAVLDWRDSYGIEVDENELKKALEIADEQTKGNIQWDDKYVQSPIGRYNVYTIQDLYAKSFKQLPVEAKKFSGMMEITSIGYVCDNKHLELNLHFFEMDDVYHVGLYETVIDKIPCSKVLGE